MREIPTAPSVASAEDRTKLYEKTEEILKGLREKYGGKGVSFRTRDEKVKQEAELLEKITQSKAAAE